MFNVTAKNLLDMVIMRRYGRNMLYLIHFDITRVADSIHFNKAVGFTGLINRVFNVMVVTISARKNDQVVIY